MLAIGLQGSPRRKGNTNFLLSAFMDEIATHGVQTQIIQVDQKNIVPCKEYIVCEKKGYCPIDDDMTTEIYPLLRAADIVVAATPVFFYNATAQLKGLIDRTQTLWARKYRLQLTDPGRKIRKGYLLSVGATRGKNLFEGLHLTMKYFFDAVGADYAGALTYWQIEKPGDMKKHPEVMDDVKKAVDELMAPFANRKKVLFACRENACRSQMAYGFAKSMAGDKIDVICAGSEPAVQVNPDMIKAMAEKGIDMAFRVPQSIDAALGQTAPDYFVSMGCGEACPFVSSTQRLDWDLPDPAGKDMDTMRQVRDEIEKRVKEFVAGL